MEKRQIRTAFLFRFKLGRKAADNSRDIHAAFRPSTTTERTEWWQFSKPRRDDESGEDVERNGRLCNVSNAQLRALVNANPGTATKELAAELDVVPMIFSRRL